MAFNGVDIIRSGGPIVFKASLKDSTNAKLITGTTTMTLFELQSNGTLKSYDFADDTFKTTALTTATLALTHRTGNNGTYNSGIWSVALATVTGFTRGGMYIRQISNTLASPPDQERIFQYGDVEGDFTVSSAGLVSILLTQVLDETAVAATVGAALNAARAEAFGKWVITGTIGTAGSTLKLYASDGVTVLKTFDMSVAKTRS